MKLGSRSIVSCVLIAAASVLLPALVGCGGGQDVGTVNQVIVYASVPDQYALEICQRFTKDTKTPASLVPEIEPNSGLSLVERLKPQKGRQMVDVAWCGDPVQAAELKAAGMTMPYRAPTSGVQSRYSDSQGHWTCVAARARVIVYHKEQVAQDDLPDSVLALAEPQYSGRIGWGNPLEGTAAIHAAALFQVLGEREAEEYFQSLARNRVQVLPSSRHVAQRVAAGEFALGIADSDDALLEQRQSESLGIIYPDGQGMGTLLIPTAVVWLAGAPNSEAARHFINYLARPATEAVLSTGAAALIPLQADAKLPITGAPLSSLRQMNVDYSQLPRQIESLAQGFLKTWVAENSELPSTMPR